MATAAILKSVNGNNYAYFVFQVQLISSEQPAIVQHHRASTFLRWSLFYTISVVRVITISVHCHSIHMQGMLDTRSGIQLYNITKYCRMQRFALNHETWFTLACYDRSCSVPDCNYSLSLPSRHGSRISIWTVFSSKTETIKISTPVITE